MGFMMTLCNGSMWLSIIFWDKNNSTGIPLVPQLGLVYWYYWLHFRWGPVLLPLSSALVLGLVRVVCKVYIQFWWVWADLVDICGKGVDLLKALSLNWFEMYISNSGTFCLVGKLVNFYGCGGGVWYGDTVVVLSVDMEHICVPLVAFMGYGMILEGFWYQYYSGTILSILSQM